MLSLIAADERRGRYPLLSRDWRSLARSALIAGALTLAVLPGVAHVLAFPIQTRFARADLHRGAPIAGFIALGGGNARIEAALPLGAKHAAQVVITGHDPLFVEEALARATGKVRVLVEPHATTTYENGRNTARLLGDGISRRWILVTSASHMPRAMGTFRKAGVNIEPWPVADGFGNWIERLQKATHEWGGLLVYWLEGKTDALFPGPRVREPRVARLTPRRVQSTDRRTTRSRGPAVPTPSAQQVAGAAPARGNRHPAP